MIYFMDCCPYNIRRQVRYETKQNNNLKFYHKICKIGGELDVLKLLDKQVCFKYGWGVRGR